MGKRADAAQQKTKWVKDSPASVEIQIRDPQGRWQKVVRSYETNGGSFTTSIAWDRTFADGALAPIGTYDVMVTARDLAGNESRETAHILIPAPGVTPTPLPTRRVEPVETHTPQPTPTAMATLSASLPAPTAPRAMVVQSFQSFQSSSPLAAAPHSPFTTPHSSFPLWGAAATAAIAAATGLALAECKRRKDEEARQLAEAQREAARRNAAFESAKAQNHLQGKAMLKALLAQSNLTADERKALLGEAGRKGIRAGLPRRGSGGGYNQPPPADWLIYRCQSLRRCDILTRLSKRAYNQGIVSIIPNDGPVNE